MDISADKYKTDDNRTVSFLIMSRTILGIFRRLIGFFALAPEVLSKAGIYLGGEGRD